MGLFLGIGRLGAAFAIDGAKQAPFDRAYRRLQNEWGVCTAEEDKRCDALEYAVKNGLRFENEKKPVIIWQELRDLQWKYQLAGISWPRESAIRDVCCVAAYEREFGYKGYLRNTLTVGYITDPKNIVKLGVIGSDKTPKFSERRCIMTGRILAFEKKNKGKLATPNELFDLLEREGCTTQELYNAYAQAFPNTFENDDGNTGAYYYEGLIAALNYRSWKNGDNEPKTLPEPKKKSLVTEQDLATAGLGVVDVPVVPAARLKGDVVDADLLGGDGSQIALADEVLGVSNVRLADGEDHRSLMLGPGTLVLRLDLPDFLGHVEDGPALGPAGVEGNVGDDGGNLLLSHTVGLGVLQVELEGRIGDAGSHQRGHGDDAAGFDVEAVVVPVLTEENIVVVVGEGRGKGAEGVAASGLYDLFFHNANTSRNHAG